MVHSSCFKIIHLHSAKITSQKLHALSGMTNYMDLGKPDMPEKKRFRASQFDYCPFIWKLNNHSRKLSNLVSQFHERAVGLVYKDKNTTYDEH